MYRNADIWILDEPTSSLDPEAEAAIFGELKAMLKGRMGSHAELLKAGGRYAQLFELQAAGYR